MIRRVLLGITLLCGLAGTALAGSGIDPIPDPTVSTQTIYGALSEPGQVNRYSFTAGQDARLPVEVLVPVRYSNREFRPAYEVDGPGVRVTGPSPAGARPVTFEHASAESFYRGTSEVVPFRTGGTYTVSVSSPDRRTGDYVLSIGTSAGFSYGRLGALFGRIAHLKFGLYPGRVIPWTDFAGLTVLLLGIVLGLGSAAVLLAGWLGRPTIAIRTLQRRLVPVGWAGAVLAVVGLAMVYRESGFSGAGTFQEPLPYLVVVPLILLWRSVGRPLDAARTNAAVVRLRGRAILWLGLITVGWLLELLLTAWYTTVTR